MSIHSAKGRTKFHTGGKVMADDKTIMSMMAEERVFEPSDEFRRKAAVKSLDEYKKMFKESMEDPEKFWDGVARELAWDKRWEKFWEYDFSKGYLSFFIYGKINAFKNCLDRHLNNARKD